MRGRYGFYWDPYKRPYTLSPQGYRIDLEVENFVPYLREYYQKTAAPARVVDKGIELDPEPPEAVGIQLSPAQLRLQREAKSVKHMLIHLPANPFCETCQKAKIKHAAARRVDPENKHVATRFADKVHADQITLQDTNDFGLNHERVALALKDDAIGLRGLYPQKSKGTDESVQSIKHFVGKCKAKTLRTDNSKELGKAATDLGSLHETSTPHRPQSSTRIERDISVMLGGTRSAIQQSGLPVCFWPYAAQHWCHSANTCLPYSGGKPLAEMPVDAITP